MSWRPSRSMSSPCLPSGVLRAESIGQENRIRFHMERVEREAPLYRADDRTKDNLMVCSTCQGCGEINVRVYAKFCPGCSHRRAKR